jgi:hypothetical protein
MSPVGAVSVVRVPLVAANDLTKDRPNSRSKLTFRVLERESEVTYCFRRAGDKHPVISEVVGRRLSRRTCLYRKRNLVTSCSASRCPGNLRYKKSGLRYY